MVAHCQTFARQDREAVQGKVRGAYVIADCLLNACCQWNASGHRFSRFSCFHHASVTYQSLLATCQNCSFYFQICILRYLIRVALNIRWHNHLNPDIKKCAWTEEEDKKIYMLHKKMVSWCCRVSFVAVCLAVMIRFEGGIYALTEMNRS